MKTEIEILGSIYDEPPPTIRCLTKIVARMERAHWTVADVAGKVGFSAGDFYLILLSRFTPRGDEIAAMAATLGIEAAAFLSADEMPTEEFQRFISWARVPKA